MTPASRWSRSTRREIEEHGAAQFLNGLDGILVPGGFSVSVASRGKSSQARFARTQKIPYLGLCLGMQIAVVDFARDVLGLAKAHSTEFNSETSDPVISMLDEQKNVVKMGGTMRLGASVCTLVPGTKAYQAYGTDRTTERHRHRYEFNNTYREKMENHGLLISGTTPDGKLVEMVELKDHPWYVACQFHPEFQSKPNRPHPLFSGFVQRGRGLPGKGNALASFGELSGRLGFMSHLDRITFNPKQCGGRPCIRGMRIRVVDVLQLLAAGEAEAQILSDYPDLQAEDIRACLEFAAAQADHSVLKAA